MPKLGDIAEGMGIGYRAKGKRIWHACRCCGAERWVQLRFDEPITTRCRKCSNKTPHYLGRRENHFNWKGGRRINPSGYADIRIHPEDFFYPMAMQNGYVKEHRLVVAQSLGRILKPWEVVHHINGEKKDNRLENLELISDGQHTHSILMQRQINRLERKIVEQETVIILLQRQVNHLNEMKKLEEGI